MSVVLFILFFYFLLLCRKPIDFVESLVENDTLSDMATSETKSQDERDSFPVESFTKRDIITALWADSGPSDKAANCIETTCQPNPGLVQENGNKRPSDKNLDTLQKFKFKRITKPKLNHRRSRSLNTKRQSDAHYAKRRSSYERNRSGGENLEKVDTVRFNNVAAENIRTFSKGNKNVTTTHMKDVLPGNNLVFHGTADVLVSGLAEGPFLDLKNGNKVSYKRTKTNWSVDEVSVRNVDVLRGTSLSKKCDGMPDTDKESCGNSRNLRLCRKNNDISHLTVADTSSRMTMEKNDDFAFSRIVSSSVGSSEVVTFDSDSCSSPVQPNHLVIFKSSSDSAEISSKNSANKCNVDVVPSTAGKISPAQSQTSSSRNNRTLRSANREIDDKPSVDDKSSLRQTTKRHRENHHVSRLTLRSHKTSYASAEHCQSQASAQNEGTVEFCSMASTKRRKTNSDEAMDSVKENIGDFTVIMKSDIQVENGDNVRLEKRKSFWESVSQDKDRVKLTLEDPEVIDVDELFDEEAVSLFLQEPVVVKIEDSEGRFSQVSSQIETVR